MVWAEPELAQQQDRRRVTTRATIRRFVGKTHIANLSMIKIPVKPSGKTADSKATLIARPLFIGLNAPVPSEKTPVEFTGGGANWFDFNSCGGWARPMAGRNRRLVTEVLSVRTLMGN